MSHHRSHLALLARPCLLACLLTSGLSAIAAGLCTDAALANTPTKLLRFPDLHEDQVVFTHAGDLWSAPAEGGDARRLTSHPGLELFPKFSPDGQWIAFTGQYDGDEQVYVVPASGGVPQQLTWYPAHGPLPARWGHDNQVYGWTPDGAKVLFRSLRDGVDTGDSRLYVVPTAGGLPVALPMPQSGAGDFSPDGGRMFYSPQARDFRSWKRYQGGWAQDLYLFDLATHDLEQVTRDARTDRDPMWVGDTLYFSSDRDGTLNLYSYSLDSKQTEQLTNSKKWDLRWPSDDGQSRIVYELGGELHIFDIAAGSSRSLAIHVPNDGVAMRPSRISAEGQIEGWSLSPKGERALFVARGDIFSVPIEDGPTRNLTRSSNAHDKWAEWSPDGKRIAFISDRSGEEEIYLIAGDGSGELEQLTNTQGDDAVMRYAPTWSPNNERIAFSDKNGRLWVLHVASRKTTLVADEERGFINSYAWSPHGEHLAFDLSDPSGLSSLYVWTVGEDQPHRVTDEMFNEHSPAWDPAGNYLYYLSDRDFAPLISPSEWDYALTRTTGIFAMALRKDVPHPFPPKSDEVTLETEEESDTSDSENSPDEAKQKGKKKETEKKEKKEIIIEIDFDGLSQRTARVPVEADNYFGLAATEKHLIYVRGPSFVMGRPPETPSRVHVFSLEDRKATTLAERVGGIALSADGKKALVGQGGSFQLMTVGAGNTGKVVSTGGLQVNRVPAEEWARIFDEAWRRFRDFFYVENMHGYNWPALAEQYRPLLKHVAHRSDLNYLIGEMIGELNVGHAYIAGGDWQQSPRSGVALPGARFELDAASGRYRIARILPGQNEEGLYRSPLTEIGVDAREGDFVLAIDGEELKGGDNPYRLLVHKADRPVTLTLHDSPSTDGARQVTYQPITNEQNLIYLEDVDHNRRRVDQLSDGRVGYLHIPDMGASGIREFIKHYYAQIRKEGLIVDVRRNGGGNVSPMILERLSRKLLGTRFSRNSDSVSTYPRVVFHGPMVCLLDANSGSDGDIFPHMFRQADLGPLIGQRSWGGVVGISGRGPLLDGGQVFVPEFSTNNVAGEYIIEGHGVDPDIEVINDPKSVLEGQDPQLERGIQEIMQQLEMNPQRLPERPADPVKTQ